MIGTFVIIGVAFTGVELVLHCAVLVLLIHVALSSVWYPLLQLSNLYFIVHQVTKTAECKITVVAAPVNPDDNSET